MNQSYEMFPIPEYIESGKPLQFFFSEYSLQTLFWTLYQGNLLNFTISDSPTQLIKLDSSTLGQIIPGILTEFGPKWPCQINFIPHTPPEVNITFDDIEIGGSSDLSFLCKRIDSSLYENAVTIRFDNMFKGGIQITNTLTI